jgi:hypothetical protein
VRLTIGHTEGDRGGGLRRRGTIERLSAAGADDTELKAGNGDCLQSSMIMSHARLCRTPQWDQ